ncbi:carbonic anhydrase family protein [Ottowia sp.]|uniref:carbonic anhydrase family protein n=1 Tax=Ottowia sp. TaxID=1898956 RepID=UPI002C99EA80|nr:carbonic anhydrase family protein [Ottowia sp.]HOB67531.1 carbonic anhydrase family protein [Ottowia sp.]HPZ55784.1 carbonic anhydrase family protein [Ottowia sp.]HQD46401.1 carbonic anhydrase family protein [Ottowia sp.]
MKRRDALRAAAIGSAALTAALAARAQDACAVFTPELQSSLTPEQALQRLQEGNARFVSGRTVNCDLMRQVKDTSKGQAPFAAIVGCIDSRVPPELVFDQRIGDVFAARIAGNFVNEDILGSLEFACKVAGSKLIVVLGHTECGAIKGAVDDVKLGNLTGMLAKIRPSLERLDYTGVKSSKNKELVQKVADRNVLDATRTIRDKSPVLAELMDAGKLKVVGAMHDIGTGRVSWQVG